MNLKSLTYKELFNLYLDITNEFAERFFKDSEDHADEFVAIKDMELGGGALRTALERSGKITT